NYLYLTRAILLLILSIAVITCLISHTLSLYTEMDVVQLHNKTQKLFMDNNEKNVNVEFAKSLYNINRKAINVTNLHKPDKILEVDISEENFKVDVEKEIFISDVRVVSGY
ncbi:MAG: hypothetical protein AB1782_05895, partial [Cyanobacteriota bacterium]